MALRRAFEISIGVRVNPPTVAGDATAVGIVFGDAAVQVLAEALASTAAGWVALPTFAILASIARVATAPTVVIIGLEIDAVPVTQLAVRAAALAVDTRQ